MEDKIIENLEILKEAHAIQGQKGNYDYDPYMLGLFNGLEMALSIQEDREPNFRKLPQKTFFVKLKECFKKYHSKPKHKAC